MTTIQTTIRGKEPKVVYLDGNIELGWFRMGRGVPDGVSVAPVGGTIHLQTFRIAECARLKDARLFRDLFHKRFRHCWARGDWFKNLDIVDAIKAFDVLMRSEQ